MGTPKTLPEAICNALNEMFPEEHFTPEHESVQRFQKHIRDRLAQSFSAHMFQGMEIDDAITQLWRAIFPKD